MKNCKKILKSNRGIGMELAVIVLLVFTAFAMLITNIVVLSKSTEYGMRDSVTLDLELADLGESFLSLVKDDIAPADIETALTERNPAYTYEVEENTEAEASSITLKALDEDVAVFTVTITSDGGNYKITEWK